MENMQPINFTVAGKLARIGVVSTAVVLDKNIRDILGLEVGDTVVYEIKGIKKAVKEELVTTAKAVGSQNRKNAESRIYDIVADENGNFVLDSVQPQSRNKTGLSYGGRKNAYIVARARSG